MQDDTPLDFEDTGRRAADVPSDLGEIDDTETAGEIGELQEQRERYLRLAADYDNYRKRTARDAQQERARGQGDLIKALLSSIDDLDRFAHLDPASTDTETVVQGVEIVEKNILKALATFGVEVIDPVELPFDPNLHEAVSTQPAATPDEDHMVAQVYQRGYMLKGQLLRPARVVVKQYQ
jgi:molecular chaperone GrpE